MSEGARVGEAEAAGGLGCRDGHHEQHVGADEGGRVEAEDRQQDVAEQRELYDAAEGCDGQAGLEAEAEGAGGRRHDDEEPR